MEAEPSPPSITVHRMVVLRVSRQLDAVGLSHLERILDDLIVDQGVTDLIVDLSCVPSPLVGVSELLAEVTSKVEQRGGTLELRVPPHPTAEIVDLAEQVRTFAPLDDSDP